MKIYAITPSFDDIHLPKIKCFFKAGHEFLQLRDKQADPKRTYLFVEKVKKIAENYPQAKIILNAANNYAMNSDTILTHFDLAGIQQTTHTDKGADDFCPKGRFNILSCHNQTDLKFAIAAGFMGATLSPVFPTQSHPEQTETLGIDQFSKICRNSRIPVFALGGITQEMAPQFRTLKGCAGIAMIRGWF